MELEVSSDFKKEEKIGRLMERGLFSALEREMRERERERWMRGGGGGGGGFSKNCKSTQCFTIEKERQR